MFVCYNHMLLSALMGMVKGNDVYNKAPLLGIEPVTMQLHTLPTLLHFLKIIFLASCSTNFILFAFIVLLHFQSGMYFFIF